VSDACRSRKSRPATAKSQALFGVSLRIGEAEVVTLLGRNGMGKSTTVRSILVSAPSVPAGSAIWTTIEALQSYKLPAWYGLVPEEGRFSPILQCGKTSVATAANTRKSPQPFDLAAILGIFPRLSERLGHYGNQLSGGEQQMLAIGRALMINPGLLILDEATEGLAPLIRQEIWRALTLLKERCLSISYHR